MRLHEVIDSRTHVHLVMELCSGTNLYHILKKRKPDQRLPEPLAAQIFKKIVSAVAYMHERSIVHRDLKLDNVLIDQKGDEFIVKLIDFGFATKCNKDEKLNSKCGTPQYMDPDLTKHNAYLGQAADNWALGVILFIMVTGKLPFFGEFETDLNRRLQRATY